MIAKDWLDQAVDGLRAAGQEDYLTRGLLARASYHRYALALAARTTGSQTATASAQRLADTAPAALADLQEAHDIA